MSNQDFLIETRRRVSVHSFDSDSDWLVKLVVCYMSLWEEKRLMNI